MVLLVCSVEFCNLEQYPVGRYDTWDDNAYSKVTTTELPYSMNTIENVNRAKRPINREVGVICETTQDDQSKGKQL